MARVDNSWAPHFIGIGGMRCATTWIARCIEYHPELYIPSGIKEIHFFDKANTKLPGNNYRWNYEKGLDWYKDFFIKAKTNQKMGEITPNYLNDKQSPELIHKHFPDVKLILCLREPIKRAFSHYKFVKINHRNIPKKFSEAIMDQKLNFGFLELGLYGQFLQNYLNYFPVEQILILFFNEITFDPKNTCEKIYSFLGVSEEIVPPTLHEKINSSGEIKSKLFQNFMRQSKQKIKNMNKVRSFTETIGGVKLARWLNKKNKLNNTKEVPLIDLETEQYLKEYYKKDIELLEKLTSFDLSKWKATTPN